MLIQLHSKDFPHDLVGGWQWWFPRCNNTTSYCASLGLSHILCYCGPYVELPQMALLIHNFFKIQIKPSQIQILVCHIPPTVLMDFFFLSIFVISPSFPSFPSLPHYSSQQDAPSLHPFSPTDQSALVSPSDSPQLPLCLSFSSSDSHIERNPLAQHAGAGRPPPTTLFSHVHMNSFSHVHTHGEVEVRQTGAWSLKKGPGGDAVQCKPLSQSALCWIAKLRGVGFTLRDRTLGVPPLRHGWSRHKTEDWDKGETGGGGVV